MLQLERVDRAVSLPQLGFDVLTMKPDHDAASLASTIKDDKDDISNAQASKKDVAFGVRLFAALRGGEQAALARSIGISRSVVNGYINGVMPAAPRLFVLADELGVEPRWLATGEGAMVKDVDTVLIPIYDVQLAAGAAQFSTRARVIGNAPMDADLAMKVAGRLNPKGLGFLEAEGDSMEPLIPDGARVLIDFEDTRLREAIFAFRLGDELRLKRLRRLIDGVEILSENPRYPPEQLTGQRLEDFAVIGRAIWAGSKL